MDEFSVVLRSVFRAGGRLPEHLPDCVDATGWLAWALVGLHVFARPVDQDHSGSRIPTIRAAGREARLVAIVVAMLRHRGNLSRAAKALETSRRALREHLKAEGLYPWHRIMAALPGGAAAHSELPGDDGADDEPFDDTEVEPDEDDESEDPGATDAP